MASCNREKQSEHFRLCLQLLRDHGADFSPSSYALWFHYVEGHMPWLNSALAPVVNSGQRMSQEATLALGRRLKDVALPESLDAAWGTLNSAVQSLSNTTTDAQASTRALSSDLRQMVAHAANDDPRVAESMRALFRQVDGYGQSLNQLGERFESTRAEILNLRSALEAVRRESRLDPLTQLSNRRAFDEALAGEIDQARREGTPLCLAILDLDHFKKINDTHGHLLGDRILQTVAKLIGDQVIPGEHAARVGGEEFALILPRLSCDAASDRVDRLRGTVERARIRRSKTSEEVGQVTLSGGIAQFMDEDSAAGLFDRADRALYRAKHQGRNRIESLVEA